MGTGGNNPKHKIYQRVVDMINNAFRVDQTEFGGDVSLLRNTQTPGVYLMNYDNDCDIYIEIRIKPKNK